MSQMLYSVSHYQPSQLEHRWGPKVHLIDDPYALSVLAKLSTAEVVQPALNRLLAHLYQHLGAIVMASELDRKNVSVPTRMAATHPEAHYQGLVLDRSQRVVTIGIARAGTLPSQVLYEMLTEVLDQNMIRQDHLIMSRVEDTLGHVTGSVVQGAKAGTDIEGCTLLFPDPMAATGSSMLEALRFYQNQVKGRPKKMIALHLIVTPEYLRAITEHAPDLHVYALRYDRGLSSAAALSSTPGTHAEERGLNDHDYIVPGLGGLGELLNNTWV